MSFELYKVPNSWPQWLAAAIKAETICVSKGMKKEEALEFLEKQNPVKILDFVYEFTRKTVPFSPLRSPEFSGSLGKNGNSRIYPKTPSDYIYDKKFVYNSNSDNRALFPIQWEY